MEKYEHVFRMPEGNPGVQFDQTYDLETLQPLPEWTRLYEEVKTELKEMVWIYPGNSMTSIDMLPKHIPQKGSLQTGP